MSSRGQFREFRGETFVFVLSSYPSRIAAAQLEARGTTTAAHIRHGVRDARGPDPGEGPDQARRPLHVRQRRLVRLLRHRREPGRRGILRREDHRVQALRREGRRARDPVQAQRREHQQEARVETNQVQHAEVRAHGPPHRQVRQRVPGRPHAELRTQRVSEPSADPRRFLAHAFSGRFGRRRVAGETKKLG